MVIELVISVTTDEDRSKNKRFIEGLGERFERIE